MNTFIRTFNTTVLFSCLTALSFPVLADDIDIFIGSSGGTAVAPNVVMLLDDTANWSGNATNFCRANPTSTSCPSFPTDTSGLSYNQSNTVGGNELNAIIGALTILYKDNKANINIGLATFAEQGNVQNGYLRFGARNLGDATTGATAYSSLMRILSNLNPTASATKVNVGNKDEAESLFELYQYFNSGKLGTLAVTASGLADYSGNSTNSLAAPATDANGNNYTAYDSSCSAVTCTYRGPSSACAKNYVIYVVNHGNNNGKNGSQSYSTASPNSTTVTASNAITPMSVVTPGGTVTAESARWIVEWADFLYKNNITMYVIDIGVSSLTSPDSYSVTLQQAAKLGGGKYYALSNGATEGDMNTLKADMLEIFAEIQAVNSTFASVSLPISATNRAQNQNQVYIPMFRPDADAKPLWRGNLKQYKLVLSNGTLELGDANGTLAVNSTTGFATPCAQSFWTTDSSTYWQNVTQTPSAKGQCSIATQWSDSPDGSQVEKGGIAEVIRKGNNPAGTTTWNLNRTIYTQPLAGGTLAAFSFASPGLATASGLGILTTPTLINMTDFIRGKDVNGEYNNPPPPGLLLSPLNLTRPSLHGDTIHSQPLPVTYSGSTGVYVYYGSNDGMLRAINGATGQEEWAFVAPEFYSKLKRLQTQSPLIKYPNQPTGITPTPTDKDYFFDGSIGLYQNLDSSKVWIYPSMRRGGRMLYAFDVTSPTAPTFKWKVGCPNLTNDTGCMATSSSWTGTTISSMGQTWSTPKVAASVLGHTGPVVIVGGGYDTCEDANSSVPSCSSPKGANLYVIDADTGALLASFPTLRSVAAEVALIAVATPGVIDHAYAADTGGNIYRLDFNTAGPGSWVMNRVAYTSGSGRKFLYPPALFHNPGNYVYLAIGSGDREHPLQSQYPYTTPVVNRFYVLTNNITSTTAMDLDNSSLSNTVVNAFGADCNSTSIAAETASQTKSLYLDLNQYGAGEQTVTSALIVGGMVTFSTNRPIAAASGSCATALGEARGYWLNLLTGAGAIGTASCRGSISATFVGGGIPPSPVFATVLIDGQAYPVVIGAIQRLGGSSSPISPQLVTLPISQIRSSIYWVNLNIDR